MRALRGPIVALAVAITLVLVAVVLDTQPPGAAREAALVIGAPALVAALPPALLWLVVALVRLLRRRRGQAGVATSRTGPALRRSDVLGAVPGRSARPGRPPSSW